MPQPPQLSGSVAVLRQPELQQLMPAPHAMPQAPQFAESVARSVQVRDATQQVFEPSPQVGLIWLQPMMQTAFSQILPGGHCWSCMQPMHWPMPMMQKGLTGSVQSGLVLQPASHEVLPCCVTLQKKPAAQ